MIGKRDSVFNPAILAFMSALSVIGILCGVLSAGKSPEAYEIIKETELFSDNFTQIARKALLTNYIWTSIMAFCGTTVFLIPVSVITVVVKSYAYGFTSGCIIASMGFYGYCVTLSGLVIHNFLLISTLIFYGTYGINKAVCCYLNRKIYEYRQRKNREYLYMTICVFLIVSLVAFAEAAISFMLYRV